MLVKGLCAVLFMVVLLLGGCATSVRFTHEEIRGYHAEVQERIIKGEVALNMTPRQVRLAWGGPHFVEILEPEDGKSRKEWIYGAAFGIFETRLTFTDGKVTHIISTEPGIFR